MRYVHGIGLLLFSSYFAAEVTFLRGGVILLSGGPGQGLREEFGGGAFLRASGSVAGAFDMGSVGDSAPTC